MNLKDLNIDKSWTLFLDRDGVINRLIVGNYVKTWEEFVFLPDTFQAMKRFSELFGKIFVVSNQQGIGKGIMTKDVLLSIHNKMTQEIGNNNGRIDKIYFCPYKKEDNSTLRKPNIGMALQAKKDFPEIKFKKSIMVGDSITDMEFGFKMKMLNVLISDDLSLIKKGGLLINYAYKNLFELSQDL